jgi:hypothetical protein
MLFRLMIGSGYQATPSESVTPNWSGPRRHAPAVVAAPVACESPCSVPAALSSPSAHFRPPSSGGSRANLCARPTPGRHAAQGGELPDNQGGEFRDGQPLKAGEIPDRRNGESVDGGRDEFWEFIPSCRFNPASSARNTSMASHSAAICAMIGSGRPRNRS